MSYKSWFTKFNEIVNFLITSFQNVTKLKINVTTTMSHNNDNTERKLKKLHTKLVNINQYNANVKKKI